MRNWQPTATVTAVLVILTLSYSNSKAQASGLRPLTQTFSQIDLAIQAVRTNYAVPTGLETDIADQDNTPITLDFSGGDIAQVLDALVAQRPAYLWSHEDGVYDVYPKIKTHSVGDLTVALYVLQDATPLAASDSISDLPEVRIWIEEHHLTRREIFSGQRWSNPQAKISLMLRNVRLRTILNQLIRKFGNEQWTVSHYGEKKEFIGIYF